MAITASIPVLLRHYVQQQGSELVVFSNFCKYIKRYAERYVDERPDLLPFTGNADEIIRKEIQHLADTNRVFLIESKTELKIIAIEITAEKIAQKYTQIISNPRQLFPCLTDLPKYFSYTAIPQQAAPGFFFDLLDQKKPDDRMLFSVAWSKNIPAILYPTMLSVETLLEAAAMKVQSMLQKEDLREYYLKKLIIANAGRESTAKNFFRQFLLHPHEALEQLKESSEAYYLWNQLCFYVKQYLEKVKELTPQDTARLQAIYIIEYVSTYYKNKTQSNVQRENALRSLDLAFEKPPYYFSYQSILKFTDSKGIPLLGQYTEEELAIYLQDRTTNAVDQGLPKLLIFKTDSGVRYYISKTNVLLLVARLLGDARETIHNDIISNWEKTFRAYDTLPEMQDPKAFENMLGKLLRGTSPVLFALFNAPFLELVYHEEQNEKNMGAATGSFFKNGELLSYTEILLLSRIELLNEAKSRVPFWYVTPPFSFPLRLLFGPKKEKHKEKKAVRKPVEKSYEAEDAFETRLSSPAIKDPATKRKEEIRAASLSLLTQFVPEGSTIDRELMSYERQWNKLLDKTARQNLTEDVNSLIRDYLRKIIKTLRGASIDAERIHNLAVTLSNVSSLKKITEHEQLFIYIKLYIIRLLSNIK